MDERILAVIVVVVVVVARFSVSARVFCPLEDSRMFRVLKSRFYFAIFEVHLSDISESKNRHLFTGFTGLIYRIYRTYLQDIFVASASTF